MRRIFEARPLTLLVSTLAVSVACTKTQKPKTDTKPAPVVATSSKPSPSGSVGTPATAAKAPPGPALQEAAVRKLVDTWLKAQNEGNFAAYSELYAERFTGVKRAGSYTAQYTHAEWLKDRQGMFQKPQTVSINDLEVAVSAQGARVLLTQKWQSGTFADVGPKQLVIISTDKGPRIAREEMLSSKILGKDGSLSIPNGFLLASDEGVVLTTETKDAWAEGPPTGNGGNVAYRAVKTQALPKSLLEQRGRSLRIMGPNGVLCESSIVRLKLRAKVVPHFGMAREWAGQNDNPKPAASAVAQEVWNLAQSDGRVLIGELATPCKGALWAMDASLPLPALATLEPAPAELGALALDAFRALPKYKDIQKRFEADSPANRTKKWEDNSGTRAVWIVKPKTGPRQVLVTMAASPGCAEFGDSLSAIFQVQDEAKPALELKGVFEPSDWFTLEPRAAFDFEGDGSFDILLGPDGGSEERSLLRAKPAGFTREILSSIPYLDCPC